MVILVADHPKIVVAELKIRLPKTVAVFSLETFGSPGFSRLSYWMIQTSFADDPINLVVVDGETLAVEATNDLVGTPLVSFPYLDNFLFERSVKSRSTGAAFCFFF